MFKKRIIGIGLAATLSAPAMAGTWTPSSGVPTFATELFGDGTVDITPTTAVYTMAATPGGGSAFNVDYTLNGGTWGTALTSGSLVHAGGGAVSITLVDGGGAADSTARFRVDVSTAISATDTFTLSFDIDDAGGLSTAGNNVSLGVTLQDNLGNVDTVGTAGAVASSATGTPITAAAGTTQQIDVTTGSTNFTNVAGGSNSATAYGLGTIVMDESASPAADGVEDDGATAWEANVSADAGVSGATITISGDFSASVGVDADSNAATNDGVQLALTGGATLDATTLTAEEATFTLTGANVAAMVDASDGTTGATGSEIIMHVDGSTPIGESNPTGTMTIDWTNAAYADSSADLDLATVQKNGSQITKNFALTPSGIFRNWIRISNTSNIAGDVFLTLYADDGTASPQLDLSDIEGQSSNELAGQASTGQININDIYAAAQAADPSFDVDGGKLRVLIEGEFSSIDAQSITVSTDNSTFSTFQ